MRKLFVGIVAALALFASTQAMSKEKITYAYLIDPSMEGILYGIKSGIVKSDLIEIEATALAIPALIQSTPTRRYDVIMNAVMAIPLAAKRGLELVVLSTALRSAPGREGGGVWVKNDSPYKKISDLKGKTIGNVSLRSTGTTWLRIALNKKYGVNVSYKGGDFKWVQLPAPALLGALETGRIEAAALIHAQAYKAGKSKRYRVIAYTNRDIHEIYGVDAVPAVNVSYPSKLKARPAAFREFNRMLKASVDYAVANPIKVGKAISKEHNISPEFFAAWLQRFSSFPAVVSKGDAKAMETVWAGSKEMGILKKFPKAESVIWKHAIRE
jgi:NitT/TauT family transport system substrate-binding protein